MRKYYFLTSTLIILCIIYSCKKKKQETADVFNPTAYTLQYPGYVGKNMGPPVMPADNPMTVQGVALGKKLFYESMLSGDQSMSCASCHRQVNAFDDSNAFSKGINGGLGTRNAMAIINMAWSDRFFWGGRGKQ